MASAIGLAYLGASVLFILGIKRLSSPRTAPSGNLLAAIGMAIAIVATLFDQQVVDFRGIAGGIAARTPCRPGSGSSRCGTSTTTRQTCRRIGCSEAA